MHCAQGRLDDSPDERERAAHVRLEANIALLRQDIAQLKTRLKHSFEEPGGFVAIGEELRQATERLRLMQAELNTRKFETREEVWWCSRQPVVASGNPAGIFHSARRRWGHRFRGDGRTLDALPG